MKHYLHNSLRALFLSLAVLLSLPMLAVEVEIDGINYDLNAETKQATVIAKSSGKYFGKVVIPESVEHEGTAYSVTSIGDKAFDDCDGLTSVTIPNSVTSIEFCAFEGCSGLTSVTIPNSVTSIKNYAFRFCSGLTSVTIPNSVTNIGESAFSGCSGLTSIVVKEGNPVYDSRNNCNAIIETATNSLHTGCKTTLIPNSVTSIGRSAFSGCSGLTSVTIPNSVTSIKNYAFSNCSGLTSVTIPNSVTSIGDYAFRGCRKLLDVYCYAEKVPSTESRAFESSSIADATLHVPDASVDSYKASYPWSSFGKIVGLSGEEPEQPEEVEIGGINYELNADAKQATVIKKSSGKYSGEVVIPESVEHEGAAYSVTSIGIFAFYICSGLTSVTIPNSVTSIGNSAFWYCSGLTSVTIGNSVESIEYGAFCGCSALTSVTIPNSVTSIGSEAFGYCPELLDVYCYAEKVPSTVSNAFRGSYPNNATLHVPDASIDSYKTTAPWSSFGKIVGLSGEEPEQPEVEKCATPVVTYAEGKLSFSCETEEAEFITKVMSDDITTYYDAEIEFSATYNIEVYATKSGYDNSDTISVALVWVENGDVSEETGVISVEATPVLIQGNGGVLNISGVAKNTEIVIYTVSGTEVARATATEGTTTINTGLQSGTIVIVKFGNKSVKVRI